MDVIVVSGMALVADALRLVLHSMDGVRVLGAYTVPEVARLEAVDACCVLIDELVDETALPLQRWRRHRPDLAVVRVAAVASTAIDLETEEGPPRSREALAEVLRQVQRRCHTACS